MTGQLAEALAQLQAELPEVRKTQTAKVVTKAGREYSYAYADLEDCTKAIMPLLAKQGLSFSAKPTLLDGALVLNYILRHVGGEDDRGVYPLPDPTRVTPQEIGSAITYARRYTLCAVTGLAPGGDDDDGAAASKHVAQSVNPKPRSKPKADAAVPVVPVVTPDTREPLWADIRDARIAKRWSQEDVAADFAMWSKSDDHPEGKKLMDAAADELMAYLETLKEVPAL